MQDQVDLKRMHFNTPFPTGGSLLVRSLDFENIEIEKNRIGIACHMTFYRK
jgi:hypothetical protein